MKLLTITAAVALIGAPVIAAKKAPAFDPADPATVAILHVSQGGNPLGTIAIRFFPEAAPNHVRHFLDLAAANFYDGTHFHRVIPGFLVQGGDPRSRNPDRALHGTGFYEDKKGRPVFLQAEISDRKHVRGTVGMARGSNLASASSQFYVCVADAPHLDQKFTILGEIAEGIEIVDRIVATPRDPRDNPLTDVVVTDVEIARRPDLLPPAPETPPLPRP